MIWSISLLLLSWNVNPFFCVTLDSPTKNPLRPWWSLSQLSAAGSYDSTTFNTAPCPSLPTASLEPKDLLTRLNQSWSDADLQVRAALKNDKSPGGAVLCVVYRGTVLWTAGYGFKNMSDINSGPPDQHTGFRIGSITKVITALQTLILRDRGVLKSLDQDITTYYPQFTIRNPFKTKRGITFRQLLSHMSGLPRNTPCYGIFEVGCNITDKQLLKNIARLELMFPPGMQPVYSNLGFGLLGQVLAHILGSSWDESVSKMVFRPLGMTNTGNKFSPADVAKIAVGYYPDGTVADLIDIGWDAPAGQTYSSVEDLAKIMTLAFSTDKSSGSQLLDGESVREWMSPAYLFPDGSGFSYPWELRPLGNYTLRSKDGVMNGYNAQFTMATESKLGYIFLQSCDGCASHAIIKQVARKLLMEAAEVLAAAQAPPRLPPSPQDYVGDYTNRVGHSQDVTSITMATFSGSPALYISQGYYNLLLEWKKGEVFQTSAQGSSLSCSALHTGHVGALVHFMRDQGTGQSVVSLTMPGLAFGVVYMKTSVGKW